ncbi:MAG: hypothetical protein H6811_05400 [Phycisphaeraceae bacterium]|nr:hypothetical protein [Phycisphaeraceae bacterium]
MSLERSTAGEPDGRSVQVTYARWPAAWTCGDLTGYDFAYTPLGSPLQQAMKDFRMIKRVNHAVIAPTRIMISKNVHIRSDLGIRYDGVDWTNGDPLITAVGLSSGWTTIWTRCWNAVVRGHRGVLTSTTTVNAGQACKGSGSPRTRDVLDVTKDSSWTSSTCSSATLKNGDGKVALSRMRCDRDSQRGGWARSSWTTRAARSTPTTAKLIDWGQPDRNRNGIYSSRTPTGDGIWDRFWPLPGLRRVVRGQSGPRLGWRDGVIDADALKVAVR